MFAAEKEVEATAHSSVNCKKQVKMDMHIGQ